MRYFFLVYALIALLVVGIFGARGQKFSKPPVRIFPDMDEQDKIRAQKPDAFFADGHAVSMKKARLRSAEFLNTNSAVRPVITTPATSAITSAQGCRRS
jgi:hypothetical protein